MASRSTPASPARRELFSGYKFWLSQQVPLRSHIEESARKRGATFVRQESDADVRIVDHLKKIAYTGKDYHSYEFVTDSIKNNRVEDLERYIVGVKSAADRPVGSVSVAAKRQRNPFTKQDDQLLYNWVEPLRQSGGCWKGNTIYEDLAREYPQHTYQSWRSRYLSIVKQGTNMTITEHIGPSAELDHPDAAESLQPSPKRRRLNESDPRNGRTSPRAPRPASTAVAVLDHSDQNNASTAVRQPNSPPLSPAKKATHKDTIDGEKSEDSGEKEEGTQPDDMKKSPSALAHILPSALEPREHADVTREEEHQTADEEPGPPSADQVSDTAQDDDMSISSIIGLHDRRSGDRASASHLSPTASSVLQHFSREEIKQLYRAVPHIHHVEPEMLAQSWESVATNWGHHTAAEYQLFYETTLRPAYMRRNDLTTLEDLSAHVNDLLDDEQHFLTQQQETGSGSGSESDLKSEGQPGFTNTAEAQMRNELKQAHKESQKMFLSDSSQGSHDQDSDDPDSDDGDPANSRKASPELETQLLLSVVEVRKDGNVISQHTSTVHSRPLPSTDMQGTTTSPKKRLFGRTLDMGTISSQMQGEATTVDPIPLNLPSLGTASTTSALVSLSNQSITSSKRPPESGQRPPNSATTSQEASTASEVRAEEQIDFVPLEASTGIGKTMAGAVNVLPTSRDVTPTVNLFSEEIEDDKAIASSPYLSDTGSEYMAFETAPQRSQLWNASQSQSQSQSQNEAGTEIEDENNEIESDDADSVQYANHSTPKRQLEGRPMFEPINTSRPVHPSDFQPGNNDSNEDLLEVVDPTEAKGSPELDVPNGLGANNVHRLETQLLFQESIPELEDDTTIFDLPPPEGGWEQYGDLEDDLEDVRESVEFVDHDVLGYEVLSRSETDEIAAELTDEGAESLTILQAEEVTVVSDQEDDQTTSSIEENSLATTRVSEVRKPVQPVYVISSGSERTTSSHSVSSRMTDPGQDDTADSSAPSNEQGAIESWFADQPRLHSRLDSRIVNRLASTALQATVLNLPAAIFTLRDMIASFDGSEATRRVRFDDDVRVKREHTDGVSQPRFRPRTSLTEDEAKGFLPQDVLGVWTIIDDQDFLSRTMGGLERVERKHGTAGVRKRAKFLRLRYGHDILDGGVTPRSKTRPVGR